MSISESFKKNVSSGDVDNVRAALINSLMMDRTFKKFDEELTYAKNNCNYSEGENRKIKTPN